MDQKTRKLLETVFDSLGRSDDQNLDEVKSDLQEMGIDADAATQRMMAAMKASYQRAKLKRLDAAREQRLAELGQEAGILERFKDWTREMIIERLEQVFSAHPSQVGFAYRDLDGKDDDDLRALLQDLEITLASVKKDQEC